MNTDNLVIGEYLQNVKCENFLDPETGRVRVRPLPNQGITTDIVVECSRDERERYPLGTKFLASEVKVCIKPFGRKYLRAKDHEIIRIN